MVTMVAKIIFVVGIHFGEFMSVTGSYLEVVKEHSALPNIFEL